MSETTTNPEVATVAKSLEELRLEREQAFAAVINGPVFRPSNGEVSQQLDSAYDEVEASYLEAEINDISSQIIEATANPAITDAELKAFIEELVNQRAELNRTAERSAMLSYGGKLSQLKNKYFQWYANTTKSKRIAAGVGLGALGSAVSTVAGSVAGLAAGAAAGGVAGWRFARGYASKRADIFKDSAPSATFTIENTDLEYEEQIQGIRSFLQIQSRERLEAAKDNKKAALKHGIGSLAVGAVAGVAVREIADSGVIQETSEKIKGIFAWINQARQMVSAESDLAPSGLPEGGEYNAVELEEIAKRAVDQKLADYGLSEEELREFAEYKQAHENVAELAEANSAEQLSVLDTTFDVDSGHGYTHELQEAVKGAYGVELSSEEAWKLHQELVENVGRDYINMVDFNGDDVYSMGSGKFDIGLSSAGKAEWDDRAVEYIHDKFGDRADIATAVENPSGAPETVDQDMAGQQTDTGHPDTRDDLNGSHQREVIPEESPDKEFRTDDYLNGAHQSDHNDVAVEPQTPDAKPPVEDNLNGSHQNDRGAVEPNNTTTPAPVETGTLPESTKLTGLEAMKEADAKGTDGIVWEDAKMHAQNMYDYLNAGNIDMINDDYSLQRTLQYIQKDIGDMIYPGTDTKILELKGSGLGQRWIFNENPTGNGIPAEVIALFEKYANAL